MTKTDTMAHELEGARKQIDVHQEHVLELIAKLRDSEAGAAVLRKCLDGIALDLLAEHDDPRAETASQLCDRIKAALSTTAGVALLERVRELEECLPKLLAINEHRYVCRCCLRSLKEGHAPHCDVGKAQELLK